MAGRLPLDIRRGIAKLAAETLLLFTQLSYV